VIEKFEQEVANIAFAIVLMSPDDLGATVAHATEQNLRARQNVIYELGYFQAKLGRAKVSLLRKGNVEIPSDIYGIIYISFDAEGEWKRQLTKEMQAADMVITPSLTVPAQVSATDSGSQLLTLPNLKVSKAEVEERIKKQIEAGTAIAKRRIRTVTGLKPAQVAQDQWNSYNIELLTRSFEGTSLAEKYKEVTATPNATYQRASRGRTIMRAEIERGVRLLTSILKRLELLPDVTLPIGKLDTRQADLYDLLAELKDARSKYIRFSRGSRRGDSDEHERLISAAQKVITRASRFDDKPCPTEALQMVIPSHASDEEIAEFRLLHEAAKNSLKYIGDIWLTVNQVTKNHNFAEFKLWGEYEDRNFNALDQGIKRISTLINEPAK